MMSMIEDLDYFEIFDQSRQVCGGVYTQVDVRASTSRSIALADVQSIAIGDNTSTWAKTTTNVTNAPFFTSSYARADGTASAQTGGYSSKLSDTNVSSSIYVNYVK